MWHKLSAALIIFYHLFLWLYRGGVFLVSFFNPKARLFIKGRVNVIGRARRDLEAVRGRVVWMHAASLGEFEQGKPVLRKLMAQHPDVVPVITFFSPSGYEIVKRKKEFPYVYYLPMDSLVNAQQWLKISRPSLVLWVKYEYWYFYLKAIQRKNIPLLMVSGVYHRSQPFFRWYGSVYRKMLPAFTHFFVQNHRSKRYLSTLVDKTKITVSGDTRCDRVIEIANDFKPVPFIESFVENRQAIVCGSTWEADEDVWAHFINTQPDLRFIIAPHEIDKENIASVKNRFKTSISYSEWTSGRQQPIADINCLIIDNIGMLARLYHYADIAYVGGGFSGNGLHNILEAAVYGKPVLFGPAIDKNFEASQMIEAGGAICVATALVLEEAVNELLTNGALLNERSQNARNYILKNAGASQMIMDYVNVHQLL